MSQASGAKYSYLLDALRRAVEGDVLSEGEKLPPVRELAWTLKITPGTVARAYREAVEQGLLEAAVGRGTFVAPRAVLSAPVEARAISEANDEVVSEVISDIVDLKGSRVPDTGQGVRIATLLADLGKTMSPDRMINYSLRKDSKNLRHLVTRWVGEDHVGRMEDEDVILSHGAQNGTLLALQTLLEGERPVILAEPLAYTGVRHVARLLRAELHGVEMDAEGIVPAALEMACKSTGARVLLTSAEVHSPTTIRTSHQRKQEIVDVARRYQLHIIEDDCHRIQSHEIPAYRALYPKRSWYVSSLSKTVSAALRFGYVICPHGFSGKALQVAQGSFYALPGPMLALVEAVFSSGTAERSRAAVARLTEERVQHAVNMLGRWDISWAPGAPFIWLRLPPGWRNSRFALACEAGGVRIRTADEFTLPNGHAPHAVRLAVNPGIPAADFQEAMRMIDSLLANPPRGMDS